MTLGIVLLKEILRTTVHQAFFRAPPKKTQGKKLNNSETQGKSSNSSKKLHFSAFLWNFFKRLEKIMNFSLPYVKKTRKVAHFDQKLNEKLKTQGFF